MEAIRIFLAFATYMNFKVYQMDVKSAFLNGKLKEEVYVKQPPGFESSEFPDYVCKLDKALYGLKQAPKAWMTKASQFVKNSTPETYSRNMKFLIAPQSAKKQQSVAISSTEAAYVVAAGCCASILWMKSQLSDYDIHYKMDQLADIFTKPLDEPTFTRLKAELGINLQLDDAKGIDCLPNATIFEQLSLMRSRRPNKKDTRIPQSSVPSDNIADETVYEEMDDSLVRATTTAFGLEAEQDSGNIDKTQSKATPNESSSPGTSSGGCPRRQETMGDTIAQTRFENVSKLSNDQLLARGNTLRSGEDRLKLQELMELCTTLQSRVLALENTKTAQTQEITSLKLRVKKLKKKGGSKTHKIKRLYKVGRSARMVSSDEASLGDQEDTSKNGSKIDDIDKDVEITLVDETQGRYGDDIMFDVSDLAGEERAGDELEQESIKKQKVDEDKETSELKSLMEVIPDEEEVTIDDVPLATKPPTIVDWKIHTEGKKSYYQIIRADGSSKMYLVFSHMLKIFDREDLEILYKLVKSKYGSTIPADQLLAERLQAREQEELTIKERAILFHQLLEKRRNHFAAKRVEEKRNRPPTKAQQRSIMCTYLKNMKGWKPKDLKNKSFDSIQKLFDKAMKKQKVDEDKETAELKSLMEVIPDEEEVAVDVIPLATKPPSIVDWKIHKEGKKSYYQIIRADGSSKMYLVFSHILKSFDREDLET
ncbi:uncharacterized mitochondrial protein-like protein [Tanacetum coccineum]